MTSLVTLAKQPCYSGVAKTTPVAPATAAFRRSAPSVAGCPGEERFRSAASIVSKEQCSVALT